MSALPRHADALQVIDRQSELATHDDPFGRPFGGRHREFVHTPLKHWFGLVHSLSMSPRVSHTVTGVPAAEGIDRQVPTAQDADEPPSASEHVGTHFLPQDASAGPGQGTSTHSSPEPQSAAVEQLFEHHPQSPDLHPALQHELLVHCES
jgi:hypothetical protein